MKVINLRDYKEKKKQELKTQLLCDTITTIDEVIELLSPFSGLNHVFDNIANLKRTRNIMSTKLLPKREDGKPLGPKNHTKATGKE